MEMNYKQTFDAVCIPTKSREQIRSILSSRFSENEKEDSVSNCVINTVTNTAINTVINNKNRKRLITVLLAAIISISLLSAAALAYGSQIINMLGGSYIESGKNKDGSHYTSITIYDNNPAEVSDGKVFITLDGIETDITSYCTETTFFKYEKTDENGYRHILVIGGAPDNLGWADFVWDEKGQYLGSGTVHMPGPNYENPIWLERARAMLFD